MERLAALDTLSRQPPHADQPHFAFLHKDAVRKPKQPSTNKKKGGTLRYRLSLFRKKSAYLGMTAALPNWRNCSFPTNPNLVMPERLIDASASSTIT